MKIGIVGSRNRKDKATITDLVKTLPPDSIVISGGCSGVDTWAIEAARKCGLQTLVFLPDLPPSGSSYYLFTRAFHARNKQIAENSDIIHAFPDPVNPSKGGTANTIKHALKLKIPVIKH